ncbi:nucleotidyltransferase domain-containing protein [Sphingomonas sp. T9W2]|uniref:nucleotidyltransferase domain-containing protein n=1 Tax=Sphingomonas sp. T9W2 TaxID=3143183 RepID=UPI0031F49BA8
MRLKPNEVQAIKTAAREAFGEDVVVRLFGSRVRDDLRGGDIDLLVEVEASMATEALADRFRDRLFERIDEQKVDVVFAPRSGEWSDFARMVAPQAVMLP